ncbi:ubiquitin-conjugating enzyme E2-binding protein [Gamsiella multidivaricata]|uniref:ubiquitin-conjugating enzyme E2-binding protein n=1 Tax=Gamsiella multidivaricata TaxID=101098 RepID=UPI00221FCE54|nr:ubiquitin-conjugating enzyme E2-binding protein [Gamsiella multidivaricata]KAI7830566.1 ubiquitin-conjugating enzyme E2-binding protein [Gamsiella multidivaricata]
MPTKTTVDPSSTQSSLITLKLAALPQSQSTSLSTTEFPSAPLPAVELQGLKNLGCGRCGNILLKCDGGQTGGPIQRVVDLPSEHWQELVDCWMCHEEDFTELREGDLGARLGQALVGGTYVLIHATNVDIEAVEIEEDARTIDWTKGIKRRWRPLACSRCLYPIGDGWYQSRREDGTDLELIQVKFHKYAVRFQSDQSINDERTQLEVPKQRFASYVAAEIFESARHHATYRFILQDRLTGQDIMLIWMLNWDSTVFSNQAPMQDNQIVWDTSLLSDLQVDIDINSTSDRVRSNKVMKVLYLSEDESQRQEGSVSKEAALWDRWRGDPGVERLQFHKHLLLGLLIMLEQSTSCLPPILSGAAPAVLAMDGMRMGSIVI